MGILSEDQYKYPTGAKRRKSALEQFPSRFASRKKKKGKGIKTVAQKIDEALESTSVLIEQEIATPNDVQPIEGVRVLKSALADSGLIELMRANDVQCNVSKDNMVVTCVRNGVKIFQIDSIELVDSKTLANVLAKINSIASGRAPEAHEAELNRAKEYVNKLVSSTNKFQKIADKLVNNDEEE